MSSSPNDPTSKESGRSQAVTDSREYRAGRAFVELADTLDGFDVVRTLTRLADISVELLAAEAAGLMLGDVHRELRVVAVSNRDAELLELLRLHTGEGPCLTCYHAGLPVTITDLTDAPTWTRVAPTTDRPRFRSIHALPLHLRHETIGTLNLFHSQPGPLPAADLALGQALADIATVAILQERTVTEAQALAGQLQTALSSRVVIEQAKGVVAHHHGIPMPDAFDRLRRYARTGNHRLAEVSRQVVEGDLDPAMLPSHEPRARHSRDRHHDRR